MKHFSFVILLLLASINNAMSTETLDCTSDKYTLQLHVGSTGYFGEVLLYEEGKKDFISIKRNQFKTAYLSRAKKEIRLEFMSDSDSIPSFSLKLRGQSTGTLMLSGNKYKITCDW